MGVDPKLFVGVKRTLPKTKGAVVTIKKEGATL